VGKKVTVLFWNINKKDLKEPIARLAALHEVDVLLLAECAIEVAELLLALNSEQNNYFFSFGLCEKIKVFTRFADQFSRPVHEEDRLTIRRLTLPLVDDVLLAVSHFPSKVNWTEGDQMMECINLVDSIRLAESKFGHERTILVGDLNMNPFERGMVAARGLHSTMDRNVARKERRVVQERAYSFFYNPMWSFLGDLSRGKVAGTHYYDAYGRHVNYHWNMFDQVLIRPGLIDKFIFDELDILTTDGVIPFIKENGLLNKTVSDHLPLKFSIYL
jgi:hypothetical protein